MADSAAGGGQEVIAALRAAARRGRVAQRLAGDPEQRLLQSIVDATATLFDAEAASIALFEPDPDRLVFRVAAGEQGAGAIGLTIPTTRGLAGYVFSTGQPLAMSDVANDPRFDRRRRRADRLRAPLDRRGAARGPGGDGGRAPGARQARQPHVLAARHGAARGLRRTGGRGHRRHARAARPGQPACARRCAASTRPATLDPTGLERLVADITRGLDGAGDVPFWRLVDALAGLQAIGEREQALAADIVAALSAYASAARRTGARASRTPR